MAEIAASVSQWKGIYLVKWEKMNSTDTANPFACPSYPIKSIQVSGRFAGAICTIQGCNEIKKDGDNITVPDNATFSTLNQPQGNVLVFTDAAIRQIQENTYWVRPVVTGGDESTGLDIHLLCVTER